MQWSSGVLGHQEPSATVGDDDTVGEQLRVCLQQGQPQPAVQHVRLWVSYSAQVSHNTRRVHSPRRHLELAERGDWFCTSVVLGYLLHCFGWIVLSITLYMHYIYVFVWYLCDSHLDCLLFDASWICWLICWVPADQSQDCGNQQLYAVSWADVTAVQRLYFTIILLLKSEKKYRIGLLRKQLYMMYVLWF